MIRLLRLILSLLFLCSTILTWAQQIPIGTWQSHYTYNSIFAVEKMGDKIFAGATHLYSYSLTDHEYTTYSKANGLSDINIKLLRYDSESGYLIIVYANSNIDIYKDNTFQNIPDIKNLNITGSKRINSIYFKNKFAYLSTDFGIVVLNPDKLEIKETYTLQKASQVLEIKDFTSLNGKFYTATSAGVFSADENNTALQNFANWTEINQTPCQFIFAHNNKLYYATSTSLYSLQGTTNQLIYTTTSTIVKTRTGVQDFYIAESGDDRRAIIILDELGSIKDTTYLINPLDIVEVAPNEIWEADFWEGLIKLNNRKDKEYHVPNGIYSNTIYNLSNYNGVVYVASGGEADWNTLGNRSGYYTLDNGTWQTYNSQNKLPAMDSVNDIMDIVVDSRNNDIYLASFGNGLVQIHPDFSTVVYKNTAYLQPQVGNGINTPLVSLQFDNDHNLWMSNYGSPYQLVVKKADNTWQKFAFPYNVSLATASQIAIDDANQKWMVAPRGVGVYVLNDNNTIDNKSDDQIRKYTTGAGYGNLPTNDVNCIVKDKNGKIWIGTSDGIGIINCPESATTTSGCDAELKIVKYDLNAGLLFQRENVTSIAVDGANNKWIGTTSGVWLISDDAEKILQRFTIDNSPLPSNEIRKIMVHPITGEVFFATVEGLISYRAFATEGSETNDDLLIFPNPVSKEYNGTIAIKGLVTNADVRITDVSGQLVFRTIAQGGQATWNGKNYLGQKPKSGVYYVFVSNTDGAKTKTGKFIIE